MHSVCFLLMFSISTVSQPDNRFHVVLTDSSVVFSKKGNSGLSTRTIKKELTQTSVGLKQRRFEQILDSLGFFCRSSDTLSDRSVALYPGDRAVVDTEIINGIDTTITQILPQVRYPRFYNAAEFSSRAHDLTTILAENGYPFATVSLELKKITRCSERSRDTFSVVFNVITDEMYVNVSPVIYGTKYTNKRLILNDISVYEGSRFDLRKQFISQLRLKSRPYIYDVIVSSPEIVQNRTITDTTHSVVTQFYITDKSGIGFDGAAGISRGIDEKTEFNGKIEFSLLNVFHAGEVGVLGYSGDNRQQRLDAEISKPWLFNLPVETTVGGGVEVVKEQYGFIHGSLKVLTTLGAFWSTGVALKANETTASSDSIGNSGHYYGASFIISGKSGAYVPQKLGHEVYIDIGSGISNKDRTYSRTQVSFNAGMHIPLFSNQAVVPRIHTHHLITTEETLLPAETFRLGGNNSLRGYADDEYAFRTVLNGQIEYLMYFSGLGAVYIFTDGGIGYSGRIGIDNRYTQLMGYGLGVRVPSKIGTMTLEWGRNIQDTRNLGRIHIRYRNNLL